MLGHRVRPQHHLNHHLPVLAQAVAQAQANPQDSSETDELVLCKEGGVSKYKPSMCFVHVLFREHAWWQPECIPVSAVKARQNVHILVHQCLKGGGNVVVLQHRLSTT